MCFYQLSVLYIHCSMLYFQGNLNLKPNQLFKLVLICSSSATSLDLDHVYFPALNSAIEGFLCANVLLLFSIVLLLSAIHRYVFAAQHI